MNIQILLLVLSIVANLSLGLLILARTYQKNYGWYFLGIVLTVSLWALGDILLLTASESLAENIGAKLFYLAPLFTPLFVWYFSYSFPDSDPIPKKSKIFSISSIIVWCLIFFFYLNFVFNGVTTTATLNVANPKMPGFIIYGFYLSLLFVLSFRVLTTKLKKFKGVKQEQIAYTYYGILISSTLAMFTNVILPVMGKKEFIWLGPIFTIIAIASISLSIIKHKLFDIRIAALRTLAYVFLLVLISVIYVATINIATQLFATDKSEQFNRLLNIIVALVVAYTFFPIKKGFDKITNRFLFRDSYNPQDFINNVNSILVNTLNLQNLLNYTAKEIKDKIKTNYCDFYIDASATINFHVAGTNAVLFAKPEWTKIANYANNNQRKIVSINDKEIPDDIKEMMNEHGIEVITKLSSSGQDVGSLIVGQKKSGNELTNQDLQLLEIIADEVAIAVQNALRYEEIAQFNVTLQKKVDAATSELQKSNEKLQKLDEAKDEFISMASHQLRTPLTSVKGYLSMLLEGDAGSINDSQKKFLDQAYVSSQRMVYLIADLLNVSRLRTGKFVIEPKPTYLPDVVESEISQLYETAKARELELTFDKPSSFPTLNLDETKTRQVIMNFVDNAIYYTPKGGKITIELKASNESAVFTVNDTGIGVPKAEQHHLFTKFYRAGNAKKARPDGTGLGLFMAKKVVVAQGGSIIFKTQEGKGSTFGFNFPLEKLQVE